jgi:hypothetical protein
MNSKVLTGLKNILLPGKISITIYIILVLLISFLLPIYPVNIYYEKYDRYGTDSIIEEARRYTGYQPLAVVLIGEFNWILSQETGGENHYILETWDCSANPIFLLVYILLFVGIYIASGLIAIYLKSKMVKGVKDLE